MKTNDRKITDLMATIHTGKTQLPDFQRGWVWDDSRIKALIASITNGYPVGAAMFLEYGNESIHFKSRVVEGAPSADKVIPDELILDGQQRLTSVYSSLFSEKAVRTRTDKGQEIERFYYIDMAKAVNSTIDRVDSIISVPKDRKITSDFGRKVELDLSSASQEYAQNVFPLNIILDPSKYSKWQMDYMQYHQYDSNAAKLYMDFLSKVIVPLGSVTTNEVGYALDVHCIRFGLSQKRVLPEPEPPIISTFLFLAYLGFLGRLLIIRLSVCVRMMLFSNTGSTKGLMSSAVPQRAEPYSTSFRYFLAFLPLT